MQNLINQQSVLEDTWQIVVDTESELPQGNILVEAGYWLENQASLTGRSDIGIYLNGDADLESLQDQLNNFDVIAVNFPAFADGRGYSLARLLKERYNYQGEIRAIGDVLIDQLYFMKRCGFDTYLLKDGLEAEKALQPSVTPTSLPMTYKPPCFAVKPSN